MDQELSAAVERLQAAIADSAAETRRHMGVVAEGLRHELQLVAEGHTGLDARLHQIDGRIHQLDARMTEGFAAVDSRFRQVRADISQLRTDVNHLASR